VEIALRLVIATCIAFSPYLQCFSSPSCCCLSYSQQEVKYGDSAIIACGHDACCCTATRVLLPSEGRFFERGCGRCITGSLCDSNERIAERASQKCDCGCRQAFPPDSSDEGEIRTPPNEVKAAQGIQWPINFDAENSLVFRLSQTGEFWTEALSSIRLCALYSRWLI
jgi:hypothetical protein